ncbi:helix-turn-helix domain-containing protein [Streptomyces sp. NPDC002550]
MPPSPTGGPHRPFDALAEHLTSLRQAARLTQRALADAANVSRGAVQRAESGTTAPSMAVLDAYLRACTAGEAETARAHFLRNRGRTAQRDRLRTLNAPAPPLIHTKNDLGAALAAAYERAGAPCLSDARLTPGRRPLPRTTAWRIVKRKGLPATTEQLVTFLTACGLRPAEHRPYLNAYHRITAQRGARPLPAARRAVGQITGATPLADILRILEQLPNDLHRELLVVTSRVASREAHRNGATVPDLVTATNLVSHGIGLGPDGPFDPMRCAANDHGVDCLTRTSDGRTVAFETKNYYQHRPGQPPEALPTRASQPPPPRPAPVSGARCPD